MRDDGALRRGLDRVAAWLAPVVPARRLALVRTAVATFACVWIAAVTPDLLARAGLGPARFDPVGVAGLTGMVPPAVVAVALAATGLLGVAMVLGVGYRVVGPAFAVGLLWLASYRNSWGHLSHGEHLLVLHVLVLALAPAADALRVRAREGEPPDDGRYGWPLRVIMLVTVSTYAIAGLAKLRGGGGAWISGEAVRLHVAHEALRMTLVGGGTSPLSTWLLPHGWVFAAAAVGTVVLELGAPLCLADRWLGGWLRRGWIAGLWAMHLGIWAVMGIGFAYPLSGVAFAAFWPLPRWLSGGRSRAAPGRAACTRRRARRSARAT